MIRIRKPSIAPKKLLQDGKKKRRSHCTSYSKNASQYKIGEKAFSFDCSVYAHITVKQALIKAQHGKCCFCERLIGTDGDVEHFRPKQAYKQSAGEPLQRPGYYWLAYEWDNLYLACSDCNQRHKQNLFPLQEPTERATSHHQKIDLEKPLFIDPGKENPEEFIGFRGEFAFPINGNVRGRETCDSLRLNERSLPESRLEQLQRMKVLYQVIRMSEKRLNDPELQKIAREAKESLGKAIQDSAQFASAFRWAVQTEFQYVVG